jgi:hypothetical protein
VMKLYTYQEELLNDVKNGESVVCNWARGAGKTFMFSMILLKNKPSNVLYVGFDLIEIGNKINEILRLDEYTANTIKSLRTIKNEIKISFRDGSEVFITKDGSILDCVDYVFYDSYHRPEKETKEKYVVMMTKNNGKKQLQQNYDCKISEVDIFNLVECGLYDNSFAREHISDNRFLDEWAIKSKKPNEDISFKEFKEKAQQRLQNQFLTIGDSKDTVLTRKNLIEMMKDLDSIGR